MKKLLATAAATLMLASVAGVAGAHHNDDHTANHHGLCTAAFSGSENGQDRKRDNGNSFQVFLENVGDYDEDGDVDYRDLAAFCMDDTGGFGNPGQGNDPHFGPEDDCEQEDAAAREECEALSDHPGGTGDDGDNGRNG